MKEYEFKHFDKTEKIEHWVGVAGDPSASQKRRDKAFIRLGDPDLDITKYGNPGQVQRWVDAVMLDQHMTDLQQRKRQYDTYRDWEKKLPKGKR